MKMSGREYLEKSFQKLFTSLPRNTSAKAAAELQQSWGFKATTLACSNAVSNATFVPGFRTDQPGRRCVGSNHDGDWLLFLDDDGRYKSQCFLWNPSFQTKVQLPSLSTSLPQSFLKCLVSCYTIPLQQIYCRGRRQVVRCCYTVYFFYKNTPDYIWCSHEFPSAWKEETLVGRQPFCDVVLFGSSFCGITLSGLFYSPNLKMSAPSSGGSLFNQKDRTLVAYHAGDQHRLFFIEKAAQSSACLWQVWELDFLQETWVSISNLEGIVLFSNGIHSAAYSHPRFEGNCICFTVFGDADYFYVLWLADKTLSAFKNHPNTRFPVWFPNLVSPGSPWLSFVEKDVLVIDQEQSEKKVMTQGLSETFGRENVYHQLTPDLHRFIAESLDSPVDYANIRLVCRNLRETVHPICWKPGSTTIQFPWLMLCKDMESCTSVIDPTCNMKYQYRNQELSGCKIRHSKDGWLLVTKGTGTVFFFEPFSQKKICLPSPEGCSRIHDMSFSSSPTSPDWIIISAVSVQTGIHLALLSSTSESWNFITHSEHQVKLFHSPTCNPVFHDQRFYFLCKQGCGLAKVWFEEETYRLDFPVIINNWKHKLIPNFHQGYLVSCENDLCLVVVGPLGKTVDMYKLDVVGAHAYKWNQVKIVENFSLFISEISSFAVPDSEMMRTQQEGKINLPMFAEDNGRHLSYDMGTKEFRYSDDDSRRTEVYERKQFLDATWTWIQPKLIRGYRYI